MMKINNYSSAMERDLWRWPTNQLKQIQILSSAVFIHECLKQNKIKQQQSIGGQTSRHQFP